MTGPRCALKAFPGRPLRGRDSLERGMGRRCALKAFPGLLCAVVELAPKRCICHVQVTYHNTTHSKRCDEFRAALAALEASP